MVVLALFPAAAYDYAGCGGSGNVSVVAAAGQLRAVQLSRELRQSKH